MIIIAATFTYSTVALAFLSCVALAYFLNLLSHFPHLTSFLILQRRVTTVFTLCCCFKIKWDNPCKYLVQCHHSCCHFYYYHNVSRMFFWPPDLLRTYYGIDIVVSVHLISFINIIHRTLQGRYYYNP